MASTASQEVRLAGRRGQTEARRVCGESQPVVVRPDQPVSSRVLRREAATSPVGAGLGDAAAAAGAVLGGHRAPGGGGRYGCCRRRPTRSRGRPAVGATALRTPPSAPAPARRPRSMAPPAGGRPQVRSAIGPAAPAIRAGPGVVGMPVAPAERCTQTVAQAGEVGGVGQVRGWWHVGQRGLPALSTPTCRTMDRPTKPTAAAPLAASPPRDSPPRSSSTPRALCCPTQESQSSASLAWTVCAYNLDPAERHHPAESGRRRTSHSPPGPSSQRSDAARMTR